jgi:TolB-like protein
MLVSLRLTARTLVAVFCAALAVALMGAGTQNFFGTPTLVIFPYRPADGMDPSAGIGYANQLGAALKSLGGMNVVMADPATVPADYLHVAKAAGADYYFMGSFSPPTQNTVPLIEQIVSARSGTVVWSSTAYLGAATDVVSQAPAVKTAVTQYITRGYEAVLNPPSPRPAAKPTQTPAPKKVASSGSRPAGGQPGGDGPPLKLPNEAYGFSSKPTAPPKVYAAASRPSRFVVLNFVGKDVPATVRDYTVTALETSLKRRGQTVAEGDPLSTAHRLPSPELCADTGASYLVFGSISATAVKAEEYNNYLGVVNALLNVSLYSCSAQKFLPPANGLRGAGGTWQAAVQKSADAAVSRYLMKAATVASSS